MLNKILPRELAVKVLFAGLILLCVLVVAPLASRALLHWVSFPSRQGFYAVFLTNGQVYFGAVSKEDENRVVLNDIYYVQLKNGTVTGATTNDASLVKLGNEFHGPEDMMEINRSQILFIEKLKADGTVAKALESSAKK